MSKHSKGEGVSIGYCIIFSLTAALPYTSVSWYTVFPLGEIGIFGMHVACMFPSQKYMYARKKLDTTQSISFNALVPYGWSGLMLWVHTCLLSAQLSALSTRLYLVYFRRNVTGPATPGKNSFQSLRKVSRQKPRLSSGSYTYRIFILSVYHPFISPLDYDALPKVRLLSSKKHLSYCCNTDPHFPSCAL